MDLNDKLLLRCVRMYKAGNSLGLPAKVIKFFYNFTLVTFEYLL